MDIPRITIDDIDVDGKRVLVRVDYNVPFVKGTRTISDPARIVKSLPTLNKLLEKGAKTVILMSHLGRPNGQVKPEFSMDVVAEEVAKHLGQSVTFVPGCVGPEVEAAVSGEGVFLLENLRFHIEEEGKAKGADGNKIKADKEAVAAFRAGLARLADVYVNDAFGTAHRAHSSMVGDGFDVRASGYLLQKEIDSFHIALHAPHRPYLAILGGAKVSSKIGVIDNLLPLVDDLIICGGMAFTFRKVLDNMAIGNSLYDDEGAKLVEGIMEKAANPDHPVNIHLPIDFLTAAEFKNDTEIVVRSVAEGIPDGWEGLDCGPQSLENFKKVIAGAKTIVWNGPAGVFEFENFSVGTRGMLDAMIEATKQGTISIIGGGDTASCANIWGVADEVTHVSTGGGASLELLSGIDLPGIAALTPKTE
eukprot:TRINITY_DN2068_c0_g1_i1.p1 TRINITY_DN2068_c0_g1~~TRINITY_DN2068_c0_g1_i1.p1  ORF type:complete len:419 (-),score=169.20 TRINITY_DN2068_c0_g1_i1:43-1299(-)